jgi:hypothetical protein
MEAGFLLITLIRRIYRLVSSQDLVKWSVLGKENDMVCTGITTWNEGSYGSFKYLKLISYLWKF